MQKTRTINTGLDGFILMDEIVKTEKQAICGFKTFSNSPLFLGIESLAQLGAFHVRYITCFNRHAFLLKINQCQMSAHEELDGKYELFGTLESRSASAFSYTLQAEKDDIIEIKGEFLFATVDYDLSFRKEILQKHYQDVFSCLQNDSKKE